MDNERYNQYGRARLDDRQIDELIGFARGLVADGSVNDAELLSLADWLHANAAITSHPVIRLLHDRVSLIMRDSVFDDDEKRDLFDSLAQFCAGNIGSSDGLAPTSLPLCQPAPRIEFVTKRFCFTGTFDFGSRKQCEEAVVERGGESGTLTMKTNYLVIGSLATESWKHSTFGTKIMKAVEHRNKNSGIAIVSEHHWRKHLTS